MRERYTYKKSYTRDIYKEKTYTWRGHIYKEDIHIDIYKGHTHGGNIHMKETYIQTYIQTYTRTYTRDIPIEGIYTWRKHIYKKDIYTDKHKGYTYKKDIYTKKTYTWRIHKY